MDQKELTTALHAQLKERAREIFDRLNIQPGNYTPADIEKTLKLSENYAEWKSADIAGVREALEQAQNAFNAVNDGWHLECAELAKSESKNYMCTQVKTAATEYNYALGRLNQCKAALNKANEADRKIGDLKEPVTISVDTFTATIPAALVFAKLVAWEREFSISTAAKAKFVKEEEAEIIASCIVDFPKEAKYIVDYVSTDQLRPIVTGVCLDTANNCIVATDTHVLTVIPITASNINGDNIKTIIDAKVIKACAGQRCTVEMLKDVEKDIRIRTEKGDVYTTASIRGNYPAYDRVLPKVNRIGLVELTKEGIKTLANFAKGTVKQAKDSRDGNTSIRIEVEAYADHGTAVYYDPEYQREKKVTFNLKGSPEINVAFEIHAFNLSIVTKNWDGCFWYQSPFRPITFDNINTACTIAMPMQPRMTGTIKPDECAGIVEARKRWQYMLAEAQAMQQEQAQKVQPATTEKPDYSPVALAVADLCAMIIKTATTAKTVEIRAALEPVCNALELAPMLGTLLAMSAKALEIERLAESANIDLTAPEETPEEQTTPEEPAPAPIEDAPEEPAPIEIAVVTIPLEAIAEAPPAEAPAPSAPDAPPSGPTPSRPTPSGPDAPPRSRNTRRPASVEPAPLDPPGLHFTGAGPPLTARSKNPLYLDPRPAKINSPPHTKNHIDTHVRNNSILHRSPDHCPGHVAHHHNHTAHRSGCCHHSTIRRSLDLDAPGA